MLSILNGYKKEQALDNYYKIVNSVINIRKF